MGLNNNVFVWGAEMLRSEDYKIYFNNGTNLQAKGSLGFRDGNGEVAYKTRGKIKNYLMLTNDYKLICVGVNFSQMLLNILTVV